MRILYIDCDSLRPDHLGCYGYQRDTSPNIDELAERGRRFTNYYASDAPCGPSRTALFSSRFGIHNGVVNHGGTNADPRRRGPERGFNGGSGTPSWPRTLRDAGFHTTLVSPFPQRHGAFHVTDGFDEWHDTGGGGIERADVVYDAVGDWLDANAEDDDWYLHVNFWDPHTPYDTPMEYGDPFADDPAPEFPDEETIQEQYESYGPHSAHEPQDYQIDGPPFDLERVPDQIQSREDFVQWVDGYDTGVRFMDDYIGKLLDDLREAGVYEDTLVILTADHGENLGELNVYGDHQTADEKTCNIPLIVSGPGVESGVDDDFHYNVDLGPTVNEFVGAEISDGWDGQSFASSLESGDSNGRDHLVVSQGAWACQRAVRWDEYVLIRTYHDGLKNFAPVELYDVERDPHETTDLALERPDVVREGLCILQDWTSARLQESATGVAGGQPQADNALEDPLWRVMREGGPFHAKGFAEDYAERLRETGREDHAEKVETKQGVVSMSVAEYLADAE